MSRGALADLDPGLEELSLGARAVLRAAHLRRVARYAADGVPMTVTPAHLADAASLLDSLARLSREATEPSRLRLAAVDPDPGRPLARRFNWQDNLTTRGAYGFKSSVGDGTRALTALAGDSWLWSGNVLAGAGGTYGYPPGTTYLATVAAIGFTAPSGSDPAGFALSSASPYRGGADVAAVMTATAGARALSEAPSAATRGIRVQK